jgi:hypothetical protein
MSSEPNISIEGISEPLGKLNDIYQSFLKFFDKSPLNKHYSDFIDNFEKLIKSILTSDKLLNESLQEISKNHLLELICHQNTLNTDFFEMIIRILNFLETNPPLNHKILEKRRQLICLIVIDGCLCDEGMSKLGRSMMNLNNEESFSHFISLLFALPSKLSNFLEMCPSSLKSDCFIMKIFNAAYKNEMNGTDFFIILLNKILIQAGARIFLCLRSYICRLHCSILGN